MQEVQLNVESGPCAGTIFLLGSGQNALLGSGRKADWRLPELAAEHAHFKLVRGVEVWPFSAVGLGGRALPPGRWSEVEPGDLLWFGPHALRVEFLTQTLPMGERRTRRLEPECLPPGYEVQGQLGRGGFGAVYAAVERASGRRVALKILTARGSPEQADRFRREAEIGLGLDHPHVVRAFALGEVEGSVYVAMELVEGPSLEDRLGAGLLSARFLAHFGAQIADALTYLEGRNLVHRDVKPSNILIGPGEQAKLADFGLAKDLDQRMASLTATGVAMGTMAFISPEQLRDAKHVTIQADVYSLGASLYRCASGSLPYRITGNKDLAKILTDPPFDLGALCPGLPDSLVDLIHQTLAKEPGQRPRPAALASLLHAMSLQL